MLIYYNGEIRDQKGHDRKHDLTAEELRTGRHFPLHLRHQSQSTDCLRFPGAITGGKERAIVV